MARRGPRRNAGRTCSPECPTPPVRRPPRTSSRIGASIGLSQKGRHNGKHPALHCSAGSPDRHLRPLPSRGHARRDIPATSVADHASSVWSVVTTLLFNLLCADPSGQRESCMAFSLKSLRNGKHLALHCSAGSPARRHRQLSSRGHARLDSLATSVADHASSVWSVATTLLFNLLRADPSGQHESRPAFPRKACAMRSTLHCIAAPAPLRAVIGSCPQGDTRA